jgi:hypothetical protein
MNAAEAAAAHNVTTLDSIAGVLVFLILTVSVLTLFGMAILMAVGAVMSYRPLVTSWPSDQEHTFAPFERRGAMSNSRAWAISLGGSLVLTIFTVGVYFGVAPDKKDVAKDMNMSNLTKKRGPATAAPKPDPAAKPESAPSTEAPKPDTPAPEEAPKQ